MGEIADMILEGEMCQQCGEILKGHGYPTLCRACQQEANEEQAQRHIKQKNKIKETKDA